MNKLKIEYVPIGSIKKYERNAKLHPAEQVEQIKKSIEEFGFNDPIAVWHGTIVEGHGRLMAAEQIGMTVVPVIRLDEMTDEQRRAYMLVHNKTTMNSGFDAELLDLELDDILDVDMSEFGFEPADVITPEEVEAGGGAGQPEDAGRRKNGIRERGEMAALRRRGEAVRRQLKRRECIGRRICGLVGERLRVRNTLANIFIMRRLCRSLSSSTTFGMTMTSGAA